MRAKVFAAAVELGYRPNLIARSLITKRSGIVGVAVSYMDNQFYPMLIERLAQRLSADGKRLLLLTGDPRSESDPAIEDVLSYQVDALILASTMLSSRLASDCRAAGIPVVLINRTTADGDASSVTADNIVGAREIGALLARTGHRRWSYLAGLETSSTNQEREQGFNAAAMEAGLPAPLKVVGNYQLDRARQATRDLLAMPHRPDAIFCANDHMAFAAIEVARFEFGLNVGSEISIVGFDDVPMAGWPSWSLTTFSQPVDEMISAAVDIINRTAGDVVRLRVPGTLVIRDSVRLSN